jgi:hypothetical protein
MFPARHCNVLINPTGRIKMNMTQKVIISFAAVVAFSVIVFANANAVSTKPAQVVASSQSTSVVAGLNSPETPAAELNDLQYN